MTVLYIMSSIAGEYHNMKEKERKKQKMEKVRKKERKKGNKDEKRKKEY